MLHVWQIQKLAELCYHYMLLPGTAAALCQKTLASLYASSCFARAAAASGSGIAPAFAPSFLVRSPLLRCHLAVISIGRLTCPRALRCSSCLRAAVGFESLADNHKRHYFRHQQHHYVER